MKNTFLLLLICCLAINVRGQNMSFDETVRYITSKANNEYDSTIVIKKDGSVYKRGVWKFNLLDLEDDNSYNAIEHQYGIYLTNEYVGYQKKGIGSKFNTVLFV